MLILEIGHINPISHKVKQEPEYFWISVQEYSTIGIGQSMILWGREHSLQFWALLWAQKLSCDYHAFVSANVKFYDVISILVLFLLKIFTFRREQLFDGIKLLSVLALNFDSNVVILIKGTIYENGLAIEILK